jgi:hypothetical protein
MRPADAPRPSSRSDLISPTLNHWQMAPCRSKNGLWRIISGRAGGALPRCFADPIPGSRASRKSPSFNEVRAEEAGSYPDAGKGGGGSVTSYRVTELTGTMRTTTRPTAGPQCCPGSCASVTATPPGLQSYVRSSGSRTARAGQEMRCREPADRAEGLAPFPIPPGGHPRELSRACFSYPRVLGSRLV